MVFAKPNRGSNASAARRARGAFSLVDVLVTISVITVLIGIMLPTVAGVRETTRKLVCASNTRQLGLGAVMFAEDHRGTLPTSKFALKYANDPMAQPASMMLVRVQEPGTGWDGLGILFEQDYLTASGVYYCPSHHGMHHYRDYVDLWSGDSAEVMANYHYRGTTRQGSSLLARFDPGSAIVSDGLQTVLDINHRFGVNVICADMRVAWVDDRAQDLQGILATSSDELDSDSKVLSAWEFLDGKLKLP